MKNNAPEDALDELAEYIANYPETHGIKDAGEFLEKLKAKGFNGLVIISDYCQEHHDRDDG